MCQFFLLIVPLGISGVIDVGPDAGGAEMLVVGDEELLGVEGTTPLPGTAACRQVIYEKLHQ